MRLDSGSWHWMDRLLACMPLIDHFECMHAQLHMQAGAPLQRMYDPRGTMHACMHASAPASPTHAS